MNITVSLDISPPSIDDGNIRLTSTDIHSMLDAIPDKINDLRSIVKKVELLVNKIDSVIDENPDEETLVYMGIEGFNKNSFDLNYSNITSIAIDNSKNIYHNGDSILTKMSPSGNIIWKYNIPELLTAKNVKIKHDNKNEFIYLIIDNVLNKISSSNANNILWKYNVDSKDKVYDIDIDQKTSDVYIACIDGNLIKVNKDGREIWKIKPHNKPELYTSSINDVKVMDNKIYTAGSDGKLVVSSIDNVNVYTYSETVPFLKLDTDKEGILYGMSEKFVVKVSKEGTMINKYTFENSINDKFFIEGRYAYIYSKDTEGDRVIYYLKKFDLDFKLLWKIQIDNMIDMLSDGQGYIYTIRNKTSLVKTYMLQYPYVKKSKNNF